MSRTITLTEKTPSTISLDRSKTTFTKTGLARSINEQMLVTLGIISLCTLLLGLRTPLWLAISLGALLIFIQLILYLQTRFFSSMKIDLELDTDDIKNTIKADLYMME